MTISLCRLDKYKPYTLKSHKDNFDFETHIYFDDAFTFVGPDESTQQRVVNDYVMSLVSTMEDIYRYWNYLTFAMNAMSSI